MKPLFYDMGMGTTQVALCVSVSNQNIYVTFEGTNVMEPPDILANMNILWDNFGPCRDSSNGKDIEKDISLPGKVQRGWNRKVFNQALYQPLSQKLLETIAKYPTFNVIIAGHSLGAALATLYGVYVAKQVIPDRNVQVMNLGSPRVGNERFRKAVHRIPNLQIWRLVYRQDIVPRLPPLWMGYRHVGHLVHWTQSQPSPSNRNGPEEGASSKEEIITVKAYHQDSCLDNEQPKRQCEYMAANIAEWNAFKGNADDHEHDNYKEAVELAKQNLAQYWPRGFERTC